MEQNDTNILAFNTRLFKLEKVQTSYQQQAVSSGYTHPSAHGNCNGKKMEPKKMYVEDLENLGSWLIKRDKYKFTPDGTN